jgi:hypothetical protein
MAARSQRYDHAAVLAAPASAAQLERQQRAGCPDCAEASRAGRGNGRLPLPDYIGITTASTADINVLKDIADDLRDTSVYADKAYVSNALKQCLEEQNTSLNTPVKKKKGQQLSMMDEILSSSVSRVR